MTAVGFSELFNRTYLRLDSSLVQPQKIWPYGNATMLPHPTPCILFPGLTQAVQITLAPSLFALPQVQQNYESVL